MHELNICLDILDIIDAQANSKKFQRVKTLWLEIGDLAGIELDALRFSFPIAARRRIAENALLEILLVEGRAWCENCQDEIVLKSYLASCPKCGNYDYQITQGKELRIAKMEVE